MATLVLSVQSSFAASQWQQSNESSALNVDHSQWDALLAKHIQADATGVNLFSYSAMSEADQTKLTSYIERLENTEVTSLSRAQQKAFWINLYNAVTVQVILDHYPLESIRDISFSLFKKGPWAEPLTTVQGTKLSLDNIEHDILRPIFKDARLHYAVNCASYSCPNLQDKAFTASNSEALLELGAQQYINHARGAKVKDGELMLSSIYKWYGDDFGRNEGEIIDHLRDYAQPALLEALSTVDRIDDFDYDWTLNTHE